MTKEKLIEIVRRRLGEPVVVVELDDSQILDNLYEARDKWIKWAAGTATQEVFFTIALSGGQSIYNLPTGVTNVINYSIDVGLGNINTLFTLDNYLYNEGYYEALLSGGTADGYSLISYQIARDFLDTVAKYKVDAYNFKYHKYTNQLEIQPTPKCGNSLVIPEQTACNGTIIPSRTLDSPGFILLDTFMIAGSTLNDYDADSNNQSIFNEDWIIDYTYALSMRQLGIIRRKFSQFASLGNTGIALDGDQLVSEADTMIEKLDEELKLKEPSIGYGILIG